MSKRVFLFVRGGSNAAIPPNDMEVVQYPASEILEGGTWDAANNRFVPGAELDGKQVWVVDMVEAGIIEPSPEAPNGCYSQVSNGDELGGFHDQQNWQAVGFQFMTLAAGVPVQHKAAGAVGPTTALLIIEA